MERMEEAVAVSYPEFVAKLSEGYQEQASCCVFFTTSNNAAGRVILENGQIIYLGYANKKGNNAIALMPEIQSLKYRVGQLRVQVPADTSLPSTELILRNLAPAGNADTATSNNVAPLTSGMTSEEKQAVEETLIDMIGPMADFFIEDHVEGANSLQEAINNIMAELNSEEVDTFKAALNSKLGR